MKITILTYGSRGDVQPFLPLSLGLMKRGHIVTLAAPSRFEEFVEGYGIQFVPLAGDPEDLSRRFNDAGFNFVKQVAGMMEYAVEIGQDILRQTEEACREADFIIHTFSHVIGAHTLACEKNIPDIHIQTFPMFAPTGDYPNVTMPDLKLRWLNRLTHVISQKITRWTSSFGFELVRRRAGLSKRTLHFPFGRNSRRPPTPILCAWSPSVLPPSYDWNMDVHVTGYYLFDTNETYQPPVELLDFLGAGKPPVCVSFGSMVNREAEQIHRIVEGAMARTGNRGIILSGWGGMKSLPSENNLYLEAVPHDWLLPRCSMVIHHGGAGTTSAGLRAGIPNMTVPFTADQPFWGRRVHEIGAGPGSIPVNRLTVEKLSQAIAEADQDAVRSRTQAIGRMIRTENGVGNAISLIEAHWNKFDKF